MNHLAGEAVPVIMVVRVDGERRGGGPAEQPCVFRMPTDRLGRAGAADVPIEADDAVGRRHDNVQVVRDHQHPAAAARPNGADQFVEGGLPGEVDALYRFIEDEQVRIPQQRPREQNALQLAAG